MVSMPGLCSCCCWKSSTTSGSMDLGAGAAELSLRTLGSHQPANSGCRDQVRVVPEAPQGARQYVCLFHPTAGCPPFLLSGALPGGLPGWRTW